MSVLETDRTIVDRISLDDAPFFVTLVNTPDWLRFIGDRKVADVDACRRYLNDGFLQSYRDHGYGYYVVKTRRNRLPMGICGFLRKPVLDYPDFGFAFLPEYCGQGYARESCHAVLEYGRTMFGFETLDAVTMEDNVRSIRLLEGLGFARHGTVADDHSEERLELFRWRRACFTDDSQDLDA